MVIDIPVVNNLKFESVEYRSCMGEWYAFVTCVDVQSHGNGKNKKYYWGLVAERDNPDEIRNVMLCGDKWDCLPRCPD
jgi:hypothetical protein